MNIIFSHNKKARRYILRIIDRNTVRITIPWGGTEKYARTFLEENIELVKKKQKRLPQTSFKKNTKYINQYLSIKIVESNKNWRITEKNKDLIIAIPSEEKIEDEETQRTIKKVILQKLKKEAKIYLPQKTFELALKNNFKINTVKINTAKTRWGSCSFNNNINLTAYLLLLPQPLINYIILHELSHTIHKNHSTSFYQLLDNISKDYNHILRKEIKKYSPEILPYYFKKM